MGDVIRIHRATVSSFKGVKQFNANIFFNSSWALFPLTPRTDEAFDPSYVPAEESKKAIVANNEYTPFAFFGKSFTFDKIENKIIRSLRSWAKKSFQEHMLLPQKWVTKLKDIPKVGGQQPETGKFFDFDLICKIIQILRIDEYSTELRLLDDSGEVWFCQGSFNKFRCLWEGAYVRIRSANLESHHKIEKTFGMKPHSNILILPYPCKLAQEINLEESFKAVKILDAKLFKAARVEHPVIATEITDEKLKQRRISTFDQILACKKANEVFRVRFRFLASQ